MSAALRPAARAWVEARAGETLVAAEPLTGATSSEVWRVVLAGGTRLVLRLFTLGSWLEEEPDLAAHEFAALAFVQGGSVRTPGPIAVDERGLACGVPAVLMEALPGAVDLRPADMPRWLGTLATTLAEIHGRAPGGFPWRHRSWLDREALALPPWTARPALWERAVEIAAGPEPDEAEVFLHRDYHPTNLLFEGGVLRGVVDWVNACRGPAGVDLAHCRANLALMYGGDEADQFLARYLERRPGYRHDPYWDIARAAEHLPAPQPYAPWPAFGLAMPSQRARCERLEALLAGALAARAA